MREFKINENEAGQRFDKYLKKLCSSITEFATYKVNPDLFIIKLTEKGTIVMKNNAIKTALKHFSNSK